MPTPPAFWELKLYLSALGPTPGWEDTEVAQALYAETAAQARVVTFPADPAPPATALPFPEDLKEALFRRVAANLFARSLPGGVQASGGDGAVAVRSVGGGDREVRRLEAPFRRIGTFG